MILGNYSLVNKNPGRQFGTEVNRHLWKASTWQIEFLNENRDKNSEYAGLPYGYGVGASFVLPQRTGAVGARVIAEGSISSAQGQNGYPITADLDGVGTISDAAGGLIVELLATLAGTGSLTASITGQIEAVAALSGTGNITAAMSALAGLEATLIGTGALAGAQEATGEMSATIYVNQSQAEVQQIVDAVWNALASQYNLSGTMGEKLNGAGSAGDPWTTDLSSYTTSGTAGKILKDAADDAELASLK